MPMINELNNRYSQVTNGDYFHLTLNLYTKVRMKLPFTLTLTPYAKVGIRLHALNRHQQIGESPEASGLNVFTQLSLRLQSL